MNWKLGRVALLCGLLCAGLNAAAASEPADESPGVITLTFLGTGAPRPSETRSGPAILVEAGPHRFLIDAGSATREQMFRARGWELITGLDTIFVTHLHYDHTIAIPDIALTGFMYGRRAPLTVYGPAGIVDMCRHFEAAFQWDKDMRRLVGVDMTGSEIAAHEIQPGVVLDQDGLKITAFEVEHMPIDLETGERLDFYGQTLGFRVDYRDRSVVFSGDTRSTPASQILEYAKGVDVLVHEVQVPSPGESSEAQLANISLSVHTTPAQAGYIFEQTRPRIAVYSHIIPPQTTGEQLAELTRPHYQGPLTTAEDFMTLTIGDEISIGRARGEGTSVFEQSDVAH